MDVIIIPTTTIIILPILWILSALLPITIITTSILIFIDYPSILFLATVVWDHGIFMQNLTSIYFSSHDWE